MKAADGDAGQLAPPEMTVPVERLRIDGAISKAAGPLEQRLQRAAAQGVGHGRLDEIQDRRNQVDMLHEI